jgi:hypothetical protein
MPDIFANITQASPDILEVIADTLELRAPCRSIRPFSGPISQTLCFLHMPESWKSAVGQARLHGLWRNGPMWLKSWAWTPLQRSWTERAP